MFAELVVGLLFLLTGVAVRARTVVVLPAETAGFVGTRLVLVGAILTGAALAAWVGLLPAVAAPLAGFLALVVALVTAVQVRLR